MATGFRIELSELDHNLRNFDDRARAAISKVMLYQAAGSETYMRTHARWTDRTTNARNGLFATVIHNTSDNWLMVLSHGVDYGIWLEVIQGGKYAIVRPTWLRSHKKTMIALSKLFARMEKGA